MTSWLFLLENFRTSNRNVSPPPKKKNPFLKMRFSTFFLSTTSSTCVFLSTTNRQIKNSIAVIFRKSIGCKSIISWRCSRRLNGNTWTACGTEVKVGHETNWFKKWVVELSERYRRDIFLFVNKAGSFFAGSSSFNSLAEWNKGKFRMSDV